MVDSVVEGLRGRSIAEWQLAARANNFNLVRLSLASFVIWSHSAWLLNGRVERDEMSDLLGHTLATLAVDGFFFVSGFLVSQSLFRRHGLLRFAAMRVTRIWPGLAVSLIVTVLAFALASGRPLAYLIDGETLRFLAWNLAQVRAYYLLPALVAGDAPLLVNGSLWTITWELRCYVGLALFYGIAGAARKRVLTLATLAGLAVCTGWSVAREVLPVLPDLSRGLGYNLAVGLRLGGCFSAGIAAALWWRHIVILPALAVSLWLAAFVEHAATGTGLLAPVAMFYSTLVVAFVQRNARAATADWYDLSYGIYIYAWPVMLLIHLAAPEVPRPALALATLIGCLPLATLSWLLVERPALEAAKRWVRPGSRDTAATTAGLPEPPV